MTPIKLATVSAFALALSTGAVLAQGSMMGEYDADADTMVNQDEFNTGFGGSGTFAGMDADGSGSLSEDEMAADTSGTMMMEDYDADASGDVSEDEFNQGTFAGYDTDQSGDLSESEFGQVDTDFGEGGRFMMEDASMEGGDTMMETEDGEAAETDG